MGVSTTSTGVTGSFVTSTTFSVVLMFLSFWGLSEDVLLNALLIPRKPSAATPNISTGLFTFCHTFFHQPFIFDSCFLFEGSPFLLLGVATFAPDTTISSSLLIWSDGI